MRKGLDVLLLIKPEFETDVTKMYEKYWVTSFDTIKELYDKDQPSLCAIDAETTGLHIIKDKPFMWVFGWTLPKNKQTDEIKGRVFAFRQNESLLKEVFGLFKKTKFSIGHNLKFDLHMLVNGGIPLEEVTALKNITDTMGVCRLSFQAASARDGGDLLGLKKVSEKYIDKHAEEFEKEVRKELSRINNEKRNVLKERLAEFKDQGWGIGKLNNAFKVKKRNGVDLFTTERKQRWLEVPKEIEEMYLDWMENYPFANYSEVDENIMMEYVHSDGIYTLEIMQKFYPEVLKRKQLKVLKQENRLLLKLLKMERVGMPIDKDYLEESFQKCDKEIQSLYEEMWEIVGEYFTASQSKIIAEYFEKKTGELSASTDKAFLKKHKDDRVSQIISRLRRLEKWQSTYISRIMEVASHDGKFYTQYGQFNTVSGRLGSDAQQFPNERILTEEGEEYEKIHGEGKAPREMEIFFPRRAFTVGDGHYNKIAYFDLSQIELRCTAVYTVLLNKPDLNLCRAYMPLHCKHYKTGEFYDFETEKGRGRWNELDENGNSVWVVEDGSRWIPTDLHSETAHNALLAMGYICNKKYEDYSHETEHFIDSSIFQRVWRGRGKTVNFMRNYGGGAGNASETLDIPLSTAEALVQGWSDTFPEVANYQNKVIEKMRKNKFALNMSGRMYYLQNTDKAYRVGNYLVQGSCADELKRYIIEIDDFLEENNCKTSLLSNIHDEIQFLVYEGEEWVFPYIKKIMEKVEWMKVPVVVDLEMTETNWAEKYEEDINKYTN